MGQRDECAAPIGAYADVKPRQFVHMIGAAATLRFGRQISAPGDQFAPALVASDNDLALWRRPPVRKLLRRVEALLSRCLPLAMASVCWRFHAREKRVGKPNSPFCKAP